MTNPTVPKKTGDLNQKKDYHTLSHLDRVPFYFLEKLIQQDDLEILEDLALYIESIFGHQARASILLYHQADNTLQTLSAPSLPDEFSQKINGLQPGPEVATCGRAAYFRKPVFSEDLAHDICWIQYMDLATKYQIGACWSHPVFDSQQNLVGTLSLYFKDPHPADFEEVALMEGMVQIAGLAMERYIQRQAQNKMIQEIEAWNERLTVAIRARNMGVFDWDIERDILTWDNALCEIFGIKKETLKGKISDWDGVLTPESRAQAFKDLQMALDGKKDFNTKFKILRFGEVRVIRGASRVIRNAEGKPVRMVGVNWDITDQALAEKVLLEERAKSVASNKMASLGEMASGIAHEINNPLAIIMARTGQAKSKLARGPEFISEVVNDLEKVESTVQRIAKIIRGLKNFSRNGDLDPFLPTSINQVIEETLELCRQRFHNQGIEIRSSLAEDIEVECRSTQISQVILNLLSNSYDALLEQVRPLWVSIRTARTPKGLEIRVTDSGHGIAPDVAERVMEPFFTTKEVGKGTGLGLSISKGIIEEHGGILWINKNSLNTEFVFEIPLQQARDKKKPTR